MTNEGKLIQDYKPGAKGATSEMIINEFLTSDKEVGKVDIEQTGKAVGNVYASLRSYAERHDIPVTVRQENGNVILERIPDSETV